MRFRVQLKNGVKQYFMFPGELPISLSTKVVETTSPKVDEAVSGDFSLDVDANGKLTLGPDFQIATETRIENFTKTTFIIRVD